MVTTVRVTLHGGLEWRTGGRRTVCVEVGRGCTVGHILRMLGLQPGDVGVVVLNGAVARPETRVERGGELDIYPVVGGG